MRFFEAISTINYSWHEVAQALWQKYPNPQSRHVLSEDTIYRNLDNTKLYSKRILTKTNKLPKWGEKLINAKKVGVVEESVVDPIKKEICTYTRNIGMCKQVMSVVEKVTYKESPANPNLTTVQKEAWVESHIFGLSYAIQKFGMERYKRNACKASDGFNFVLQNLFPTIDGISYNTPDYHQRLKEHRARISEAARDTANKAKAIAQKQRTTNYST